MSKLPIGPPNNADSPKRAALAGSRVGPAEPFIRQQAAYLLVAGNQPRPVACCGADPVDHAILLQLAQQRRYMEWMSLLKGQLNRHV